ncbi:MAG: LytR C-terminal domain-containing protein [Egibacteraceae bacterium]
MGRHDDPDPAPFYTSLGSAVLRGLLALFLSFGVYAILQTFRDGDQRPRTASLESRERPADQQRAAAAPVPAVPESPSAVQNEAGSAAEPREDPSTAPAETLLSDEAPKVTPITVQVLDAGAGQRRTSQVVDRLRRLGYEVVAVNGAVRTYTATTIFYSQGRRSAAIDLQGRDQRFAKIGPNPNLSEEVDLHVLAGTDWL